MHELEITIGRATAMWWAFTWRALAMGIPVAVLMWVSVEFAAPLLGISKSAGEKLMSLLGTLAQIPIGIAAMYILTGKKIADFEVTLQKSDGI